MSSNPAGFDGKALIRALEEQRLARDLGWTELADELHGQSSELNAELAGNAMCPGALIRTVHRGTMSCQYALILLRWVDRPPEDFLVGSVVDVGDTTLPRPGPDKRLRWNLGELHAALNAHRCARGQTWASLAGELGCTPGRLTNLSTARLTDMDLAMRVTQRVQRPAAAFVHAARW